MTQILNRTRQGDALAASELLSLVYEELRRLAASKMALEAPDHTLQATALVHEAWMKLMRGEQRPWNDRNHFFAASAEAMRRILVDNARRKRAKRHGGGQHRVDMLDVAAESVEDDDQILAVNEALENFAKLDPQKAELVKLRYFVGMTNQEAASAMGISGRTATRYWIFARAWLHEEIKAQEG
jgi:RNA polymerase sigma factor (TIGR02999 family)